METTKRFRCEGACGAVEFEVRVEPSYDADTIKEQFPEALKWLKDAIYCPGCGDECEEID